MFFLLGLDMWILFRYEESVVFVGLSFRVGLGLFACGVCFFWLLGVLCRVFVVFFVGIGV